MLSYSCKDSFIFNKIKAAFIKYIELVVCHLPADYKSVIFCFGEKKYAIMTMSLEKRT